MAIAIATNKNYFSKKRKVIVDKFIFNHPDLGQTFRNKTLVNAVTRIKKIYTHL